MGIAGIGFILLGWIPQTLETVRKGSCPLHPVFAILYALGSTVLIVYAYQIDDDVFLLLNGFAAVMALANLYYIARGLRKKGKGKA